MAKKSMKHRVEYAVCHGPDRSHVKLNVEWYIHLGDAKTRVATFSPDEYWKIERHEWTIGWTPAIVKVIAEGGPDVERKKVQKRFKAQYDSQSPKRNQRRRKMSGQFKRNPSRKPSANKLIQTIDFDGIIKFLGISHPDEFENYDIYGEAYDYYINQGYSDEDAEDAALKAEEEQLGDEYSKYKNAVEATMDYLLNAHEMFLDETSAGNYDILTDNPRKAAQAVLETFNGVGAVGYIENLQDFIDIGPYDDLIDAIKNHIGWIRQYPAVYGGSSIETYLERQLR